MFSGESSPRRKFLNSGIAAELAWLGAPGREREQKSAEAYKKRRSWPTSRAMAWSASCEPLITPRTEGADHAIRLARSAQANLLIALSLLEDQDGGVRI